MVQVDIIFKDVIHHELCLIFVELTFLDLKSLGSLVDVDCRSSLNIAVIVKVVDHTNYLKVIQQWSSIILRKDAAFDC